MEIIFNKNMCVGVTGRLRRDSTWMIRGRNGRFFAYCYKPRDEKHKQRSFRVFYHDLLKLQRAKYIHSITLNETERRWIYG